MPTVASAFFTYGFNNRMDPNGAASFKRGQVTKPSETAVFTEAGEDAYPTASGLYTRARHTKRANLAFADGRASSVREVDFRRVAAEDQDSNLEWAMERVVYWYPFAGARL
jgi:prepilin-type processing-associated H-X9-DG protein